MLAVRNGIVFEPGSGRLERRDVFVRDGRIVDGSDFLEADEEIDASGCYVLPAVIDSHVHVNRDCDGFGTDADRLCLPNGVSAAIDAGSLGVDKMERFLTDEIPRYRTKVRVLIHAASEGQTLGSWENLECENISEDEIRELFLNYPDTVCGIKIRYEEKTIRGLGLEPLSKCILISERLRTDGIQCPVVVHLGDLGHESELSEVLELLRPGDVVAHVFQGKGETIFGADGMLRDCVKDARERGVLFDLAHGRMSFTFEHMERAAREGFFPDLLGTDIHAGNAYRLPACSMMCTMTMMYRFGMPLADIFRAVTVTPASAFGFEDEVNLFRTGDKGDISVIGIQGRNLELTDVTGQMVRIGEVFETRGTVRDGRVLYRKV